LITSCCPREGKSTIISNLSVSLAASDKKVVLIDGNLRFPSLHEIFDLPNERGLSNILSGDSGSFLQKDKSGLSVLTSGPPVSDPAVLFGDRMVRPLEFLKKEFDFILIDSPSLLTCPDPALLASIADGTILVLSAGTTSLDDGHRAKKILERAHARILGTVLNYYQDEASGYYRRG
jgi:capsular exopolysaccharide synthesis family protein